VRRRSWLFWAFLAVVVIGALVYVPAELARRSTGPGEPVDFLSHPLDGWRFVVAVAQERGGAAADDPAAARRIALRTFDDGTLRPERVALLWLPDRRVRLRTLQGSAEVPTNSRLVWKVTGRRGRDGPDVAVGLIDFASGKVIYDGRVAER
jgi:hypothetical protein